MAYKHEKCIGWKDTEDIIYQEASLEYDDQEYFETKNLKYDGKNESFFNFHKNSIINEFHAEKNFMNSMTINDLNIDFIRVKNEAIVKVNLDFLPIELFDKVFLTRMCYPDNHYKATVKSIARINHKITDITIEMKEILTPFLIEYSKHGLFNFHLEVNKELYKNQLATLKMFCCNKIFSKIDQTEKPRFPICIEQMITGEVVQNNLVHTSMDSSADIFTQLDNEQKEGVYKCLSQHVTIITGAPGCGKTKLLTALIEQIYKSLDNDEKILISCPTNIATDNLFKRSVLIAENLEDKNCLRLYGKRCFERITEYDSDIFLKDILQNNIQYQNFKKEIDAINTKLMTLDMNQSAMDKLIKDKNFKTRIINRIEENCCIDLFKKAKIIGTTCSMTGHSALRNLNFKLVVIDEAFCAYLPVILEAVIKTKKHLVVCFDPCQLGPMLLNKQNLRYYESKTILENHVESDLALRLRNNYRLHPKIVDLIGVLTYGDKNIRAMRNDRYDNNLMFINVETNEKYLNFSKYNDGEIEAVNTAISILESKNIDLKDIKVVTFYKAAQSILKINIPSVKIKTVDSFQGQESKAIIMVCTRANEEGNLGFLKNKRRLNVGITRASEYLIVVGNADTLQNNEQFSYILNAAKNM